MKKLCILITISIVMLFFVKIKIGYDHYVATHLPANAVVYYIPQDIYLHIRKDCPQLYVEQGYRVCQDTFGRMKNSKISNRLCPVCVPEQYIH